MNWNPFNWFSTWQPKNYFGKWFRVFNLSPEFNQYTKDIEKLKVILSNPAVLKVFTLQCDLFSLGEVYVYNRKDKIIEDDPALDRLNNPNPLQSKSQFLWDFMFWNMIGTAYCYMDSDVVTNERNKLYFLDITKIEFPSELEKNRDKLIFSDAKLNELMETKIKYRYADGSVFEFPFKKLICITDLTNGVGNWFKGPSRIDALYKIISNADAALDSNNINTRWAGKFMVAGKQDPNNVNELPLSDREKKDIEEKVDDGNPVTAVKSMIDIKRFVENLKNLDLNTNYLNQYFLIGNMYNIPRDVLEAYVSSTYENQEKARASHVSYTLQPKGNDLMYYFAKRWGYTKNRKILMDWSHLPFMQVFEKDRAQTEQTKVNTFNNLVRNGVPVEEANQYLDLNFTRDEKTVQQQTGQSSLKAVV